MNARKDSLTKPIPLTPIQGGALVSPESFPLGLRTAQCNPLVSHKPNSFCSACFPHDDSLPSGDGFSAAYYGEIYGDVC